MTVVAVVVGFFTLTFFLYIYFHLSDLPFWLIEISLRARALAQTLDSFFSVLNLLYFFFFGTYSFYFCSYRCCSVSLARDESKALLYFFFWILNILGGENLELSSVASDTFSLLRSSRRTRREEDPREKDSSRETNR